MFEGLPERLMNEIQTLATPGIDVKVIARADRKYAAFKGASTVTSLSSFEDRWVTREQYEDYGCAIINRK